jgi:hypothetical protein
MAPLHQQVKVHQQVKANMVVPWQRLSLRWWKTGALKEVGLTTPSNSADQKIASTIKR